MKLITVLAFVCASVILLVATFAVLHGVYGSPVPAPGPKPSPAADPKPKADPSPDPVRWTHPPINPNPDPITIPSVLESRVNPGPQGGDANFVALSANADPLLPAPGAPDQKIEETSSV